ncbi:MAG: outer membrane beta-barrel protein [Bacteroidales bacterium]|nr:outer membrane beta-barrel protein [Bacteroidales bacterium]
MRWVVFSIIIFFLYLDIDAGTSESTLKSQSTDYKEESSNCKNDTVSLYKDLQEFEIVASRIVTTPEGYITNLEGEDIVKGHTGWEALAFLPDISTDRDVLQIQGIPASHIFIDDMEITDKEELKRIPAEYISRVEIKYISGASNSANDTGGIIRIKLKTPKLKGFYGSVRANCAFARDNGLFMEGTGGIIRGKIDKVGYLLTPYFSHSNVQDKGSYSYILDKPYNDFNYKNINNTNSFQSRLSLSYDYSSASALRLSYGIVLSNMFPESLSSPLQGSEGILSSGMSGHSGILRNSIALEFEHTTQSGLSLDVTLDYLNRHSKIHQTYGIDGIQESDFRIRSHDNLARFHLMFSKDIAESHNLEWGGRLNVIYNKKREEDIPDLNFRKEVCEGITPLFYVEARGSFSRIKYYAGVNWQLNHIRYKSEYSPSVKSSQNAVNPTLHLTLPFGTKGNNSVSLSYSHNLFDIPYDAISNITVWEDSHNLRIGNPNLKAPEEHRIRTSLSLWDSMVSFSAMYENTHNDIYWRTLKTEGKDVFCTSPVNSRRNQNAFLLYAQFTHTPFKVWKLKLSASVKGIFENMEMDGNYYDGLQCHTFFRLDNTITLPRGWGLGVFGFVEPSFRNYSWTYHTVYQVGGSAYKYLCNDRILIYADFIALGRRRVLDRLVDTEIIRQKFTTPDGYLGLSAVWYFSGGKKVHTNFVGNELEYEEQRSAL